MNEIQVFEGDGVKPPGWAEQELRGIYAAAIQATKEALILVNRADLSKDNVETIKEKALVENFLMKILTEQDQSALAFNLGQAMGSASKLWKEKSAPRVALDRCLLLWAKIWNNDNPKAYVTSTES